MGRKLPFVAILAGLLVACGAANKPAPTNQTAAVATPAVSVAHTDPSFPALTGRVVDGANLLSPEEEQRLTQVLAGLESATSDQFVIVTVPTLGGRVIADFSRDLGNHWGIGQAGRNNGVLLVVAPNDRQARIEVGTGLTSTLTNERTQQIVDHDLIPQFRAGRWFAGIQAGSDSIVTALTEQAGGSRSR